MKTTQRYTVLSGNLELRSGDEIVTLSPGESYTVKPGDVHWSKSDDECWVEEYSTPGWTREDHISVV
jgi:mannose-6-phosphate isomerase-like protein (cupin superfamily)